ncbi:death domain-containing protein [Endozoicomonas sp. ONNA2]|uniref:death domain-containing protein n=1 Tax=Endozoicomonas sp. ONNA2 TaxID=2828741 RepID=UPI002148A7F4|nr:death domain-containing protein [Endozoicomonas sp. ONNA2]
MNPTSFRPVTAPDTHPTEPPPSYTPYPVERQSEGQAATYVHDKLREVSHNPNFRKLVLERVIKIHNESADYSADRIMLAGQDDFTVKYPEFDKWIEKKLAFLDNRDVINFAFASGHLREYYQAEDFFRGNADNIRINFFRRYFSLEGKDSGFAKLTLLQSSNIIYKLQIPSLEDAYLDCPYLEPVAPSAQQSVDCCQFNFPAAFEVITDAASQWRDLAFIMSEFFPGVEVDKIRSECRGNVTKALLTVLDKIARSGMRTDELTDVLIAIGRTDLSEKLQNRLQRL